MLRSSLSVVAASALVTAALAGGATAAGEATTTINLYSTSAGQTVVDREPKGRTGKGDVVRGASVLRNAVRQFGKPAGAVVGRDTYSFTFVSQTEMVVDVRVQLPGGTLHCRSRVRVPGDNRLLVDIVGGTGRFAGARGTGESRNLSATRAVNVYRVRLPQTA